MIVTKVSARQEADKSWHSALSRQELIDADRICGIGDDYIVYKVLQTLIKQV